MEATGASSFQRMSVALNNARTDIGRMLSGREEIRAERAPTPEVPKTPRLPLGPHNFSSSRLVIPHLNRTAPSTPVLGSPISAQPPPTPLSFRPITPDSYRQRIQSPTVAPQPPHPTRRSATRFIGVDPAEVHLAQLADSGRRRKKQRRRKVGKGCAPRIKNKRIRGKILACLISGMVSTGIHAGPLLL